MLLYGAHPYSFVSPSQSDIEKLERSRIVEFHRSCMIPNNAILIVVGDVEPSELTKEVAERFGDWQPGAIPTAAFFKAACTQPAVVDDRRPSRIGPGKYRNFEPCHRPEESGLFSGAGYESGARGRCIVATYS